MYFSIVVPTFSRPGEVKELLTSLVYQESKNFEVIIADGSLDKSVSEVMEGFRDRLKIKYLYHKGLGISASKNWGAEQAMGDYLVFFDSDCIIPSGYFTEVNASLQAHPVDVYGGPDRAGEDFNYRQKAVSYAMTSFFTTGGIRGRKMHAGKFQPRSFNMGIRRSVFQSLGGFGNLKVSEDIDLSIRLHKGGYQSALIEEAYVYHKRRTTFYKFFRQVFSFGSGRIDLQIRHGDALKPVHLLPSLFVLYMAVGVVSGLFSVKILIFWMFSVLIYVTAILTDASLQNKNLTIGLMSIYASFVMLIGYGLGMLKGFLVRYILGSRKESEKPEITKY